MAIKAYWTITADLFAEEDEPSRVGTSGPRGADTTLPLVLRFRLLDADGNLYYEGLASNQESLDYAHEFGQIDVGATELVVWEDGHWSSVY